MDVSIIIVNWNTRELLRNCLNSIIRSTHKIKYEIIVIDNNSSDKSAEMVKKEFPKVKLIANSDNRGFAAANNQGMKIAAGRHILLLNSDTVVCEDAIQKTIAFSDANPDFAVVGCQVLINEKEVQMTCFRFPGLVNIILNATVLPKVFKYNKFFGREFMLWWKRDSERKVDVVSGMFMLVKRKAIDEVGVMDESYFVYAEEADWCRRFADAGWSNVFWPGAQIIHVHGGSGSSSQAKIKMAVQLQKSLLIFIRKHEGILYYLMARMFILISSAVKVLIRMAIMLIKKHKEDNAASKIELQKSMAVVKFCISNKMPD